MFAIIEYRSALKTFDYVPIKWILSLNIEALIKGSYVICVLLYNSDRNTKFPVNLLKKAISKVDFNSVPQNNCVYRVNVIAVYGKLIFFYY